VLVFRLNADGSRDTQFRIRPLDGPGAGYETATAAAVQSDGKIVVAGRTSTNDDGAVWRLLPDGAPDRTFGGDGFVPVDSGAVEMLADVAIAPDGAIVVVGRTTVRGQATVYRLTPSGDRDAGFDEDGAVGIGDTDHLATTVAVQPDGRILVGGYLTPSDGMVVRRLTVGGAPDVTFGGGDGAATIPTDAHADDLALQPDGRIVVAGRVYTPGESDALVVRYAADGTADASFGSAVGTMLDLGEHEELLSVAVMPGGGVVASGTTESGDGAIVVKLSSLGRPDPAFGPAGTVVLPGGIGNGEGVGVLPDGHGVVAGGDGKAVSSAVVYRLLGQSGSDRRTGGPQEDVLV
jgi:uncharacterized delta-60 repeat protein